MVLLDEPVNGRDPDGIGWIRNLRRRLAGEGRTVFVSSHLMSEMALTADHLVVLERTAQYRYRLTASGWMTIRTCSVARISARSFARVGSSRSQ